MVKVYVDGSCFTNSNGVSFGGWAAKIILNKDDDIKIIQGAKIDTNNNQMEVKAIIEAIKKCNKLGIVEFKLYSDSKYAIVGMDRCKIWKSKNWVTSRRKKIVNKDIWEEYIRIRKENKVKITPQWIKGHNGNIDHNFVDKLSRSESQRLAKKHAK